MNDSETRIMSFTSTMPFNLTFGPGASNAFAEVSFAEVIAGASTTPGAFQVAVAASAGRVFHALQMYDRIRCLSQTVQIRPSVIPSNAFNMQLWAAWDRYNNTGGATDGRGVTDDPSSKQVTWTTGGNGTPLFHRVTATYRDKLQYLPINHSSATAAYLPVGRATGAGATISPLSSPFWPWLRLFMSYGSAPAQSTTLTLFLTFRYTVELSGAYSQATGADLQAQQSFWGSAGRDDEAVSSAAAPRQPPLSAPFQMPTQASKYPMYPQFTMATK